MGGRLDALVWAVTDLMANRDAAILDYYRRLSEGGVLYATGQN